MSSEISLKFLAREELKGSSKEIAAVIDLNHSHAEWHLHVD